MAERYIRSPKVIYGEDNRQLLHNYPNAAIKKIARSTAAMIDRSKIKNISAETLLLTGVSTLKDTFNVCPDESFAKELSAASCSGFLVAPNIIMTAGHCINSVSDCRGSRWVFDFSADKVTAKDKNILNKNTYKCQRIITSAYDVKKDLDYSLIELDRPVTDRLPIPIRKEGKLQENDELVVIGHPSGLPTIIADQAYAYSNDKEKIFGANLDTFSINSGSAVINKETGEVEGILIRGQTDYILDRYESCLRPNYWRQDNYPGETVTRVTSIPNIKKILNY